jgi:hypothetical protein
VRPNCCTVFFFEGSENVTVFFWALSKEPFISVRLSVSYSVTDDIFLRAVIHRIVFF